jgi:hypothetical protein
MNSSFFQPTIQFEVGLDDCRRLVHVVAVEAHGGLEPQRVARAEAGRHDAGALARREDRVPHPLGLRGRHEDLEAVFTGIAGARDRAHHAGHFTRGEPVILEGRQVGAGQRLQHSPRRRPLKRHQRVARAGVDRHSIADAGDLLGDPLRVLHDVRGVDHEHEVLVRHLVGQHVVHECALGRRERRVLDLARRRAGWRRCS